MDANLAPGFWLAATMHAEVDPLPALTNELRSDLLRHSPPLERTARLEWVSKAAASLASGGLAVDPRRADDLPPVARALLAGDVPAAVGRRYIEQAPALRDGVRAPALRRILLALVRRSEEDAS